MTSVSTNHFLKIPDALFIEGLKFLAGDTTTFIYFSRTCRRHRNLCKNEQVHHMLLLQRAYRAASTQFTHMSGGVGGPFDNTFYTAPNLDFVNQYREIRATYPLRITNAQNTRAQNNDDVQMTVIVNINELRSEVESLEGRVRLRKKSETRQGVCCCIVVIGFIAAIILTSLSQADCI